MAGVYIVVPAAGLGTRMQAATGAVTKQFLLLAGKPILVHSLAAFTRIPNLRGVWIAVRAGERGRMEALVREFSSELPPVTVVEGGDTRQQSVAQALASIGCANEDIVLVHDAVRPLIETSAIERTVAAVQKHGAAILALAATDTIKQVEWTSDGALITTTIPRENIVQAQTPQGALAHLLRRAVEEAEMDGFAGTDEASLLERAGIPVAVVGGSAANLKITQAADLPLAEWYLAQRVAGGAKGEVR